MNSAEMYDYLKAAAARARRNRFLALLLLLVLFCGGLYATRLHFPYLNSTSGLRWFDTTVNPTETLNELEFAFTFPSSDPRLTGEACILTRLRIAAGASLVLAPLLNVLPNGQYLMYTRVPARPGFLEGPWSAPVLITLDLTPPSRPVELEAKP